MISVRFDNESKVTVADAINVSGKVITLNYPCDTSDCTPYAVNLKPGMYHIELWGASGGFLNNLGAHGSYVSGILPIFHQQTFYIYLGQKGSWSGPATYNGGGAGTTAVTNPSNYVSGGSGGGSSDLRLTNGAWNDFESLKSRIIVAAGGAGYAYFEAVIVGGAGGTLQGFGGSMRSTKYDIYLSYSTGGTQTSGGLGTNINGRNGGFGYGGNCGHPQHGSGGGSGYYGGGSGGITDSRVSSGSGGSSYISGYEGCKAITKNSTENKIYHENSSIHYSGMTFSFPIVDGNSNIPCPKPSSLNSYSCLEAGHFGHGYARITILDQYNPITVIICHPWLSYISGNAFIMLFTDKI